MAVSQSINKQVNVNALYFRQRGGSFRSFPKRMEFDGQEYTFLESGLQMLIQRGQDVVKLFDMTDGDKRYKLRFNPSEHEWTLINISQAQRAL
ncbi:MAG: hypothetical protein JWM37_96 [Candidatus Saccharibacteria bacterium]|nr:hypothetical protein [Candidatus Saccharibacteria bacterium]